ncbi:radical SAM protein [Anaerosinus massiliensis]|uniref:radical SAM protein n=1 Tax=Massilibacillus massiliensis TaxID=1806837 RepID=UPI000DA5F68F|nr:radical SAM protein [Massilibacillus massiliensis]
MSDTVKTLEQWQNKFPKGFKSIALDISGFCNAKCKYCPAGNDFSHKGEFISLEKYEALLHKFQEYKMYFSIETAFQIYCLGEPLLHPEINEILKITHKCGVHTNISTNASVVPNVDAEGVKAVERVLISMPGFSQRSYDKIHGFNFEHIKNNILKLKKCFSDIPFDMTYHIYQFNMNEIEDARIFCEKNDIRFAPNYAILMDKNKCMSYVSNTMVYEELKDLSKELFLGVLDEQIRVSPRNYCDFQESYLSVNVDGDVRICSSFPKGYEKNILCGNLLKDDIDVLIQKKYSHLRCEQCISAGLTLGQGYDCKVFPDYYFSLIKENQYLKDCVSDSRMKDINENIDFMHQVRAWENDHYSEKELKNLLEMLHQNKIDFQDMRKIVLRYGRFGSKTVNKFEHIIG